MPDTYGLIFDVDGVVADTEAVNARASIRVFAELFSIEGVKRADFEEGLGRGAEAYLQAAASVHGRVLNPEELAAGTQARQDYFLAMLADEPLPAFPGVLDLIQAGMEDDRFRVAIATSSTRQKSEAVLRSAGVPYTELVYVNGDDVTRKKPDPELFQIAADRINVPPYRCAVVEDAPNGVEAAKTAGCLCIAVTNSSSRPKLSEADLVVDSLEELRLSDILALLQPT